MLVPDNLNEQIKMNLIEHELLSSAKQDYSFLLSCSTSNHSEMQIYRNEKEIAQLLEEDEKKIVLPFRSVMDVHQPSTCLPQSVVPKDWEYPFSLHTIDRRYVLFAPSNEERKMWMAGFKYVISSTQTVQEIMKANE